MRRLLLSACLAAAVAASAFAGTRTPSHALICTGRGACVSGGTPVTLHETPVPLPPSPTPSACNGIGICN